MIFFFWGDILRITAMERDNLNLGPPHKNVAMFLVET